MPRPTLGKKAPNFKLNATGDKTIALKDLKGKVVVLYFYPRDATPGCTQQGCEFRDLHKKFNKLNALILGVSRDSIKSHERFKLKQEFPFDLLADEDETLCNLFDVMVDKNMYGKKVRGIQRSTFIIDESGKLIKEWRKVKVNGHVDEVYEFLVGNACGHL